MIKPNWNIFRAKFNENPQDNFEWFCYLLFCREFNKPFGVFRYKDQSGIENNPIEYDGKCIGWQAKFYDSTLSGHKEAILDTLKKTKRDYPCIDTLYFYTNSEWSQSNGKKKDTKKDKTPIGKVEIEKQAKELSIEIVWRCASYFEVDSVTGKNELIAKHFFCLEDSIIDLCSSFEKRTRTLFGGIETIIKFNEREISLDLGKLPDLETLEAQETIIITGHGGSGKTALVKKIYERLIADQIPFYAFKASEFNVSRIEDFFDGFQVEEFHSQYDKMENKYLLVDSAERLLDFEKNEVPIYLLQVFIESGWKVIFTAREAYLDRLQIHLAGSLKKNPQIHHIQLLNKLKLQELASNYNFCLPVNDKVFDLISIPLYLKYFLTLNSSSDLDYIRFKQQIWEEVITKSEPDREQCFIDIISSKMDRDVYYINGIQDKTSSAKLQSDGVLGYQSPYGYFINHDIYEEWGIEKIIEREFNAKTSIADFFNRIGSNLLTRRCFRNWIDEKLKSTDKHIFSLIEGIVDDLLIGSHWRDEILVSILLSGSSKNFFTNFENELITNNLNLLKKFTFLLRLACKEINHELLKQYGIDKKEEATFLDFLTKPKGSGWEVLIQFVYDQLDRIEVQNVAFVLPVLHDWNSHYKNGVATKCASAISLKYYLWMIDADNYWGSSPIKKENLFQTIINGSSEIKTELSELFDKILQESKPSIRDQYHDFIEFILKDYSSTQLCMVLPQYVRSLASSFWRYDPNNDTHDFGRSSFREMEECFGIEEIPLNYYPPSPLQTPTYYLLKYDASRTISFVIEFVNKSVEIFSNSRLKDEIYDIELHLESGGIIKQQSSERIWCIYQGNQAVPNTLISIHMALEKYLLDTAKFLDKETLEKLLLSCLQQASSASITAIITSIVLANPEKTFNVATVLFKTKELFYYETRRSINDQRGNIASGLDPKTKIHDDQVKDLCSREHRKSCLEDLFKSYQISGDKKTITEQQNVLHEILDKYYQNLPPIEGQDDSDKLWRCYLSRMDLRKMTKEIIESEDGKVITFTPTPQEDLDKFRQESLAKSESFMSTLPLQIWAASKLDGNENYKKYTHYEQNPKLALEQIHKIYDKLSDLKPFELGDDEDSPDANYSLFNDSVPSDVSCALIKFHTECFNEEELKFCRDTILQRIIIHYRQNSLFQNPEDLRYCISVLPLILEKYTDRSTDVLLILQIGIIIDGAIHLSDSKYKKHCINALNEIIINSESLDISNILSDYLSLQKVFNEIQESTGKNEALNFLIESDLDEIEKLTWENVNLNELEVIDLATLFQILPSSDLPEEFWMFRNLLIQYFIESSLKSDDRNLLEYPVNDFICKLSEILLFSDQKELDFVLKPILKLFSDSELFGDLFKEIAHTQERIYPQGYDNFWKIWFSFQSLIENLVKSEGVNYVTERLIRSYLFAECMWNPNAKRWRAFHEKDKRFFKNICTNLSNEYSVFESITVLLHGVGSHYNNDGITWLFEMIHKNEDQLNRHIETNTIYRMEVILKRYCSENRKDLRTDIESKKCVIHILSFLVKHGSVSAYLLRDTIL